ncbi:hypothetical protein [Microbacterium sp.]|uniref:helix-turn-helix domain-containing protein n=1 Tax=Microbacterium sp. TaxID=51671 RepID=UPI0039E23F0C
MTNRVRKTATPLDEWVGQRIREIREQRHITQGEFADRMRERIKKGWTRQVVWQVERGEKPLNTRELMHVADVLAVTVVDLISSSEPVEIDGVERRTDDIVSGESAMPEVEGWAHFERAAEALNDLREAEARYRNEIEAVHRVLARDDNVGRSVRARIQARQRGVIESLRPELDALHADDVEHARMIGAEPPPVWQPYVPVTVAARDALEDRTLPVEMWRRARTDVRPSETAN